jgi:hypothetical protein
LSDATSKDGAGLGSVCARAWDSSATAIATSTTTFPMAESNRRLRKLGLTRAIDVVIRYVLRN